MGVTTFSRVRRKIRRKIRNRIEEDANYGPLDENRQPIILTQEAYDASAILKALNRFRMTDPEIRRRGTDCLWFLQDYW